MTPEEEREEKRDKHNAFSPYMLLILLGVAIIAFAIDGIYIIATTR